MCFTGQVCNNNAQRYSVSLENLWQEELKLVKIVIID